MTTATGPLPAPVGSPIRIRVIGSGPVGLAFALFAVRQGVAPASIELDRADAPPPPALAGRPLALSLGTWQLLARIARPPASGAIATVDVSITGQPGSTRIDASGSGLPALGHVVRYAALLGALDAALARHAWAAHAPNGSASAGPARAALVVHAEGDPGADASERSFRQCALLAEVGIDSAEARRSAGIAFECFTPDGPLALLPTPDPTRYALVWCAAPDDAQRRAALPAPALAAEMQAAFGWSLGRLSIEGVPFLVPMLRRARRRLVGPGQAWIGNAAQSLHPVAGQGLNLGMRDAFELARCIGDTLRDGRGVEAALDAYERSRRVDRSATIAMTDTLASVFSVPALRPLQSFALAALDILPPARGRLARQFMFGLR